MDSAEKAQTCHKLGYNCAQSVVCAFSERLGIEERTGKLMASGFGAGIGREQLTCGAVTGAVMAIGCRYFNTDAVVASKARVYDRTRQVLRRFQALHGSLSCRELLGVDLSTAEGQKQAREQDLFRLKCERYIMDACRVVDAMLAENAGALQA